MSSCEHRGPSASKASLALVRDVWACQQYPPSDLEVVAGHPGIWGTYADERLAGKHQIGLLFECALGVQVAGSAVLQAQHRAGAIAHILVDDAQPVVATDA